MQLNANPAKTGSSQISLPKQRTYKIKPNYQVHLNQ